MTNVLAPSVSVLMPVYNCGPFIDAAVQSILNQTFTDFEFLILDDASTDGTWDRLQQFRDPRIVLSRSTVNRGCAASCNELLAVARGEFAFRMDGDDLCDSAILERELSLLRERPEAGAVSVWHTLIDHSGKRLSVAKLPLEWPEIRHRLFFCSGFLHAGGMYRISVLRRVGGWRPRVGIAEECDLCIRLGEVSQMANIGQSLYSYRQHTASSVASAPVARRQAVRLVRLLAVEREMFGSDSLDAMPEDYLAAVRKGVMPTPLRARSESARVLLSVADRLRGAGEPREAMSYLVHAWHVHRLSVLPLWHVVRLLLCSKTYARTMRKLRNRAGAARRRLRMPAKGSGV